MKSFPALADPIRRSIVEILSAGELPMGKIAGHFKMSAPAISQHLRVLREARIVHMRVDAQRRIYQIDGAGFGEMDAWLSRYRNFWSREPDAPGADLRVKRPAAKEGRNEKKSRKAKRKKAKIEAAKLK